MKEEGGRPKLNFCLVLLLCSSYLFLIKLLKYDGASLLDTPPIASAASHTHASVKK